MYFKFNHTALCNIPIFFYPTTIMLVDNDAGFLSETALELQKKYKVITHTDARKARAVLSQKKGKEVFKGWEINNKKYKVIEYRNEVYNRYRFNEVLVVVLEYDMSDPEKQDAIYSADYFIQEIGIADYYQSHTHAYILLTSKRLEELDKAFATEVLRKGSYIKKINPGHINLLFDRINCLITEKFQALGHGVAINLVVEENTSFLNDSNFLPILNAYLEENKICEGYLFDSQGSLMLLDNKANIHWLFVRNESGIKGSIKMAKKWNAPESVIQALKSKKLILSLYEPEDFERREEINWDAYLLKADVFKDKDKKHEVFEYIPSDYYYAFTQDFPEHGVNVEGIVSYESFLKSKDGK